MGPETLMLVGWSVSRGKMSWHNVDFRMGQSQSWDHKEAVLLSSCSYIAIVDSFRDRCADVMMEGATWDITVSERNFRAEVKAHIMSKLKRWSRLAFLLPLGLLALPSLLFLVVHLLRWSVFFSLYQDWLQ